MHRLWSPWRAKYINSGGESQSSKCVFCDIAEDSTNDEKNFVVHRAKLGYVVLNIFPYISGHLLIVPYLHVAQLDHAPKETTDELMDLTKRSQTVLQDVYQPTGFNIGMNLGRAAGAGIVDHIHIHILPRWEGDTNFMSSICETRVLPEDLTTTYAKIKSKF